MGLILNDPAISDLHRSRKIIDNLLPPAIDTVRHLNPHASPSSYLEILYSANGTVEDGDELHAKFMSTLQDAGERPSVYLHRIQIALNTAIRRGVYLHAECTSN